ncbi:MAG: hypothetical protein DMD82_04960 [Candidatus Rokuibacteriota bacterium]|nr:MAG: hypothetical protein DMD82_04960 [Candidatus Rokubacteria bacterium]
MTNQRGFTLAGLLVVVAVLGLILASATALQHQGQLAYIMGSNRVEAQQNARIALTLMSREIREACAVSTLSLSAITFTMVDPLKASTVDCSSTTADDIITVKYTLGAGATATTLLRIWSTGALPSPSDCNGANAQYCLTGGVKSLTFTGYKLDNSTPASVAPSGTLCGTDYICSVAISLRTTTEESVASYSPGNVLASFDSRVRLRNL